MSYLYLGCFLDKIVPLRETPPEEDPETNNNSVLRLKENTNRMANKLAGRRRIYQKGNVDFKSFIVQIYSNIL
jgi:hypothetical protein